MLKTKQTKNNITITKHPFTNSNRSSQYNMAVTLSNNKNSIRNKSQTQKYLHYNFKDLNNNTNSSTAVSTSQTISKSISHIETEYKRILQEKDHRINELQNDLISRFSEEEEDDNNFPIEKIQDIYCKLFCLLFSYFCLLYCL